MRETGSGFRTIPEGAKSSMTSDELFSADLAICAIGVPRMKTGMNSQSPRLGNGRKITILSARPKSGENPATNVA